MTTTLDPDRRANDLVTQLTQDEKISLVTGFLGLPVDDAGNLMNIESLGDPPKEAIPPPGAVGSDGFVPGVPRLGIPALNLIGAGLGVTNAIAHLPDGQGTVFPSTLSQTASWDPEVSRAFGRALGGEARARGCNVLLAGAVNLAVDPRCGRLFEYRGEDPLLAGKTVAAELAGTQDNRVVASIKHFAANFQETGRFVVNSVVSERALRQGELLAFEIGITESGVGAVMTSYNKVNGTYSSENAWLLSNILKHEWGFPGWVMSDWAATHSTVESALAGLDQEFYQNKYYGPALKQAIDDGHVPQSRLDDMVHRILRTLAVTGVMDDPPVPAASIDFAASAAVAQMIAERGIVLLKNDHELLPLDIASTRTVAVIGGHADVGVPSGGGSAAVDPVGGDPMVQPHDNVWFRTVVWAPSSPLHALREAAPGVEFRYDGGEDIATAVDLARGCDVVIIFATQTSTENFDLPDLELPDQQGELIRRVGAANSRTVVVLETAGPVLTDWASAAGAVLEAWLPGHRGGEAIANALLGSVNPSGRLPITFPRSEDQLPRPKIPTPPIAADFDGDDELSWEGIFAKGEQPFDVDYAEGSDIGYRWFDAQHLTPAFPFGHGLSYTTFEHSDFEVRNTGEAVLARFTIANTGHLHGTDIPQIYARLPHGAGEMAHRLAAWSRVTLSPGESLTAEVALEPRLLSIWDETLGVWVRPAGEFSFELGASATDIRASFSLTL